MVDVISALHTKRNYLLRKKKTIQTEAEIRTKEVDMEIRDVDKAIETLNDAVKDYLCPHCNGSGEVRKADAAGQMEGLPCPKCNGTGVRRDDHAAD